jgi:hypothetical protein
MSEPEGASGGAPLQFEKAEPAGDAPGASVLVCRSCRRELHTEYYEISGQTLCPSCRAGIAAAFAAPVEPGRLVLAAALGAGAALAGAFLWWSVRTVTTYELGLIAVAVGFGVGMAVRIGARRRGGWQFQALAVALTYAGVALTYVPDLLKDLDARGMVLDVGLLIRRALAQPLEGGSDNIIGILIIGFALWEAWKINRSVVPVFTGPYRVGAPLAPAGGGGGAGGPAPGPTVPP